MLKQRIITGVLIVLALFTGVFLLPAFWFFLMLLAIGTLSSVEWVKMSGFFGKLGVVIFPLAVIVVTSVLYILSDFAMLFILAGTALWLVLAALIHKMARSKANPWLHAVICGSVISLAVFALAELLKVQHGAYWVSGMFILVGVADSAAYFSGRRFGKTKLAPRISPGKTREGLISGLLAVWVIALASGAWIWRDDTTQLFAFAIICFLCALYSVVGDLYVSVQKRMFGVKDSGSILPGHGGILDRIDSTLAVAPVYALCVKTILT